MDNHYLYLVEGETEKAFVNTLKKQPNAFIKSGKVNVLNVTSKKITSMYLSAIEKNTTVILVFDTDAGGSEILKGNINILEKCDRVKKIICVPQSKNLEEELIRCTNIKEPKELLGSKSNSDFKSDFIKEANLLDKLNKHSFDMSKLWIENPSGEFIWVKNESSIIKER